MESNISTNNSKTGYTDTLVRNFIRSIDVISGSSQVNANDITNFDTNVRDFIRSIDVISGSSQVNANSITNFDTNVRDYIRSQDVISGSSQVVLNDADKTGFNTDDVSEGSTNKYATTTNVKAALNANLGSATIGDSNDTITIPGDLIVTGTTTTNNVETVSTSNGVVFEGNLADDNEITLRADDVSSDRTIVLPDADGTIALTGIDQTFSGANTFSSQIVSSVSTGTAPFGVSSTTKVTNLNADLLDGLTAGNFLRSNANDTASGIITLSNSTASTNKTTGALVVTGGVGISGALNVGGDVVAFASSDERLKDNIELISNPIEKVQSLKGVTWDWNDNADELQQSLPNVGVIAQDVEKVLPELVTDRDNGYKGVDYAKLTGLLIEAIKEQQKQIDDLKSQIG